MLSSAYAHSSSSDGLDVDLEVATGSLGMVESVRKMKSIGRLEFLTEKAKRAPLLSNIPHSTAAKGGWQAITWRHYQFAQMVREKFKQLK
ncbi:hypothetical protein GH714_007205 [Hevea brasiliensis]|uniref:Uncharacterized protein n=1 Tax=Hevea brasiliensis TaxID=3981 RepID=A0A6A6KI06_HEVBR|nr:hypothetical protein GH714_007205 [Hevea brasiliensis]